MSVFESRAVPVIGFL